jgi:hypothetical protein
MSQPTTAWVMGIAGLLTGLASLATATPGTTIGTTAPMAGAQLPGHGRWFVVCEARHDTDGDGKVDATFDGRFAQGDAYEPHLVLGSGGPGIQIEHVAAKSDDGTWLAVVRAGTLELHDTTKATAVPLTADLTYDNGWGRRHEPRFASIGPGGKYMTYLTADSIVIRELATGTERSVKVQGKLWRADIENGERWAQVKVIRKDTNKDGTLGWDASRGKWMYGCTSDTLHAGMGMQDKSDAGVTLWLDLVSKTLVEDPTVIGTVGDELLRRKRDGTLLLGTEVVAKPECHARVAAVLVKPPRAAINCGTMKDSDGYKKKPVTIVGPGGFRKETTFEMGYRDSPDEFTWDVYAGHRFRNDFKRALDLATGEVIAIPDPIAGHDDHLVTLRASKGIAVFDLRKRTTTMMAKSPVVTDERMIYVDDNLVTYDDKTWDAITGAQLVRPGMRIHRRMDDGSYLLSPNGRRGPLQLAR